MTKRFLVPILHCIVHLILCLALHFITTASAQTDGGKCPHAGEHILLIQATVIRTFNYYIQLALSIYTYTCMDLVFEI